jgi:predicted RNase H-like HicB family nuclease
MKVGDYLRVPYMVTAQSVETADGTWVRRVEHPELPGCAAEAASITEALRLLDVRRIEVVLDLLSEGGRPPANRRLLGPAQARLRVDRAGLTARVERIWDLDGSALAARSHG